LVNKIHIKWLKIIIDMPLLYAWVWNYLIKDVAIYGNKSQYYEWFDFSDKFHRNEKQSCSLSLFYDPKYYPWTELVYYQWWRGDCTKIYIKRWIWKFGIADWLYDYYLAIIQRWVWKKIIDGKWYEWVDGIRIDAFEEYPPNFLSAFLSDIKKIKSDTIIIGEKRSTDIKPISQSQVDTITFYPIRQWIESLILQKWNWLKEWVFSLTKKIELFYNNNSNISEKLVNYISSHDTDRLLSRFIYTNRDLATSYFQSSWTEVLWNLGQFAWDSPWISRADHDAHYIHTAPSSWDIKDLYGAIAFQFLMPWSPIIYYGDEIGMYGADDPDNRQPMRRDIHNAFPRHICKRWNNPLEYCLTTDETEDYNWDKDLIQRYKKLIAMKKKSPSLQEGLLSMNICYILDNHLSCTWRQGNYLLWWFHRKKNNNHIIYLWLLSSFSWNIMLQVDEPNKKRTNIYSDATVFSDKKWYILLNNQDFAHWYIVLENK
jgi:glycosidase